MAREDRRIRHPWVLAWALLGVTLLLGQASVRLGWLALQPWLHGKPTALQRLFFVLWVLFQAYAEGYRGFQRSFCPRVVSRAFHLAEQPHPPLLHVVLAPFFALALFHASRRQLMRSWGVIGGIVLLVLAVRQLEQPWRGLIDGGVVVGLLWGLGAVWWQAARALRHGAPEAVGLPEAVPVPEDGG